ncbi:MAG: pyridoxal 5'-phosphate synthase glutaminase subunit PdxT [Chloroflexota bacterium]
MALEMYTKNSNSPKIGVLALQGAFIEHLKMLTELGASVQEVRLPEEIAGLDGLIIPGGESTTIGKLMILYNLVEPIKEMVASGRPVWGTCAGMILLAKDIGGLNQPLIGVMDIKVKRNAFGSQLDSFETDIAIPVLGEKPFRGVFIRAPYIEEVGPQAEELARLSGESGRLAPQGNSTNPAVIVAARQDNLLATAFHPELTGDSRFHRFFLKMVEEGAKD